MNHAALDAAIALAARYHLTLIGLHVMVPDMVDMTGIGPAGTMGTGYVAPAEYALDAQATQIKRQANETLLADFQQRCAQAGVDCEPTSEVDNAAKDIVYRAQHSDLLWLSREGLHAGQTTWFSNFEHVVRESPIPVWVGGANQALPQRLTVAYDGHAQASGALEVAASLSRAWRLPLDLLVIHEGLDDRQAQTTLRDAQAKLKALHSPPERAQVGAGHPTAALIQVTAPDALLVMGTHSHQPFLGFRRGHTVDDVLLSAQGPVLLCPKDAAQGGRS
ncbi:hypothetical protein BOO71_0007624 [Deinococcus marmoris]|uniref:UspA domain-containing protein n=2 Tax=Deinococcus marmoris TaxID=249408 RepID=A0A1U7NY28_9DEIO|nr:hypothetical protein BOO71_0007624 [Deinococcus marmoris]